MDRGPWAFYVLGGRAEDPNTGLLYFDDPDHPAAMAQPLQKQEVASLPLPKPVPAPMLLIISQSLST